mmetsp:Transcript_58030/g.126876  ORF Transcript_58030/g.126876 Transcript_58030/m.126876 type:complete len:292 (-) Transcript_58030:368-1243(-)
MGSTFPATIRGGGNLPSPEACRLTSGFPASVIRSCCKRSDAEISGSNATARSRCKSSPRKRAANGFPKPRKPGTSRCVTSCDGQGSTCATGAGDRPALPVQAWARTCPKDLGPSSACTPKDESLPSSSASASTRLCRRSSASSKDCLKGRFCRHKRSIALTTSSSYSLSSFLGTKGGGSGTLGGGGGGFPAPPVRFLALGLLCFLGTGASNLSVGLPGSVVSSLPLGDVAASLSTCPGSAWPVEDGDAEGDFGDGDAEGDSNGDFGDGGCTGSSGATGLFWAGRVGSNSTL